MNISLGVILEFYLGSETAKHFVQRLQFLLRRGLRDILNIVRGLPFIILTEKSECTPMLSHVTFQPSKFGFHCVQLIKFVYLNGFIARIYLIPA